MALTGRRWGGPDEGRERSDTMDGPNEEITAFLAASTAAERRRHRRA
jgi:hypothetical protein